MKPHFLVTAVLLVAQISRPAQEQATPAKFVAFGNFVQGVKDADASDFLARPTSKVKDAASFEEMRQYILSLYRGVHVKHSYVIGSQSVDCVPVDQQPSVRALGVDKIASEPPPPASSKAPLDENGPSAPSAKSQRPAGKTADQFGNAMGCEGYTIPMRRITLEQLSQFRTLQEFLKKVPNDADRTPNPVKQLPPR